jgi:hypothetical protein
MANDLLSALRTYLTKLSSGEKSPQEIAAALNQWAKVKTSVKKMGFAKQEDLDRLAREVELLKTRLVTTPRASKPAKKKAPAKKSAAKKSASKKK